MSPSEVLLSVGCSWASRVVISGNSLHEHYICCSVKHCCQPDGNETLAVVIDAFFFFLLSSRACLWKVTHLFNRHHIIGGRTITNLCFADDTDGLPGDEELVKLIDRLDKAATAYGMETSAEKNKLMTNNTSGINIIIIIIYILTTRVVGAPEMILQPVSSIFSVLHCPLGLCELPNCPFLNVVFPPLPLSALSSSPLHCTLQDGFGQTW